MVARRSYPLSSVLCFVALLLMAITTQAGTIISFNAATGTGVMTSTSLAGAPGVRAGNWNNFTDANRTLDATDVVLYNDGTTVGGGFSMALDLAVGQGGFSARAGNSSNDTHMFGSVVDVYTSASVTLSNIPFESYDIYVYMHNDGATRIGGFTADGVTYYARGTGAASTSLPGTDGTGYVLSSDTTITNGTDSSVDQGNYVRFSNLTGSSQILSLFAADGSTATERSKVAGFQIVQTPEPSRALLFVIGAWALVARRKRPLSLGR